LDLRGWDLVTLSPVKPDGSDGRWGGVVGLQRAFQGGRGTLRGGQPVEGPGRAPPTFLMRELYKRLWDSKPLAKAKALQEAQVWMIEKGRPPRGDRAEGRRQPHSNPTSGQPSPSPATGDKGHGARKLPVVG